MNESTIAKRYAGGLLEAADEQGVLQETREALDALSRTVAESAECRGILADPSVPSETHEGVLIDLLRRLGAPKVLEGFAKLLCKKRRTCLLEEIHETLNRLADEHAGIREMTVASARELTEEEKESLRAVLSRKLSCEVRLRAEIAPALLGGIVVRTGTTVIDGSVKTKLTKIRDGIS